MISDTFHINLPDLAALGAVFTGLTFALQLWFATNINRAANRFLALALVVMVLWMMRVLASGTGLQVYFPQFLLALGPLLYFYVRKLTQPERQFTRPDLLHFIPLLAEQAVPAIWQELLFFSIIIYLYRADKLIQHFHRGLPPVLMDRSRLELRWLRRLLAAMALPGALWVIYGKPFDIFFAALLIWTGAAALLRREASPKDQVAADIVALKQKGRQVIQAMETGFFYRDAELTVSSLAEKLGLPPRELSRIINAAFKKNFNDFVNAYRVRDVIGKMQDHAYDHITLLGIAFDSGFNSKSTFNRIFLELTGKNPVAYKARLKKERPFRDLGRRTPFAAVISDHQTKLKHNYMFKNYLKTAWRSLLRNKGYSALNIFGLALGMCVALLIGLWVYDQYSFDRFLPTYGQVYQVRRNFYGNGDTANYGGTSLKLADILRSQVPGVQYVAETDGFGLHGLKVFEKKFYRNGGQVAADFLKIFPYQWLEGNEATALHEPFSIVLTESTAKALFGNDDPLNKVVRFDNKNSLTVTGVLKDIPANSTLKFDYLVPFSYAEATDGFTKRARTAGFGWTNFMVFVKLKPGVSYAGIEPRIRNLEKTETDNSMSMKTDVMLNPLGNWHLYEKFEGGRAASGFIEYVHIFSIIGILVLLIACINFVNLTTARSEKRAKEVGVRKAIGSERSQLIVQFLTESLLLTFIAFVFAIGLACCAVPVFDTLTQTQVHIPFADYRFWLIALGSVLLTGLAAGSRPAFYLSSFEPVKVLKGKLHAGKAAAWPRKVLVVVQFSCSIALIICTCIIYQQVQYAKNRPAGYDQNRLMLTDMNEDLARNYTAIKNDLVQKGIATAVTSASDGITSSGNHRDVEAWPGKRPGESVDMGMITVSNDYFKATGMTMASGRDFDAPSDTGNMICNEAAVKLMRLQNPLNQLITNNGAKFRIIGIVKNALTGSPFAPADPTIFFYDSHPQNVIMYRLSPGIKTRSALEQLNVVFNRYNPAYPYTYVFADDSYAAKFAQEELIGTLSALFAGLAIAISCLGLLGLAAYMAEQRTREMGIRKVLGASVTQVWILLSRDFVVLVLVSCGIASAVAFFEMHNWLQQYDYRVTISPLVFLVAGAASVLLTVITVSFQALKAAIANPVKSLRTE